jgi:hypothetical protein
MKKNWRVILASTTLTLTMAVCAAAWSARQQKTAEVAAPASKGVPEMQPMNFYLGERDYL